MRMKIITAISLISLAASLQAAEFKVNTELDINSNGCTSDLNGCSLREAVIAANQDGTLPHTIFLPKGHYILSNPGLDANTPDARIGDIDVSGRLTIEGEGVGVTIIDGNDANGDGLLDGGEKPSDRIFDVKRISGFAHLTLKGVTLRNGHADVDGGAIRVANSFALLTLENCRIENSTASGIGGGVSSGVNTVIKNCVFDNNRVKAVTLPGGTVSSGGVGGGLSAAPGTSNSPTLQIEDSVFSNNVSFVSGAGVQINNDGASILRRVIFRNNTSQNGAGGGLSSPANTTIEESLFLENKASFGGAISSAGANANLKIVNSTMSNNVATARGGAIEISGGTIDLKNVTFSSNVAPQISSLSVNSGTANFKNTIFSDGGVGNCGIAFGSGSLVSGGHNLENANNTCALNKEKSDLPEAKFLLEALKDNGGPTPTHIPSQESPAIDGGDKEDCPKFDQRGISRELGGVCDIGAVELNCKNDGFPCESPSVTPSPPPPSPAANCGNGVLQGLEICDDGNKTNGDGCSNTCVPEPIQNTDGTPPPVDGGGNVTAPGEDSIPNGSGAEQDGVDVVSIGRIGTAGGCSLIR